MNLLIQFLIVSILPLCFIGMAFHTVKKQRSRPKLARRWFWTLVAAAVWSSSLLSLYLGTDIDLSIGYNWRIIGRYALSLTGTLVLLTTLAYLSGYGRKAIRSPWLGILLWLTAIALDPVILPYKIPNVVIADFTIDHFNGWAAVWVMSWLIPIVFGWIIAERTNHALAPSLYRNQAQFWLAAVSLFVIGGGLAFIRDLVVLEQVGAIVLLLAALMGTYCITKEYLPDLSVVAKQFFFRVVRGLAVFGLAWLALVVLTRYIAEVSVQDSLLVLAAALFALVILMTYTAVDWLSYRFAYVTESAPIDQLENEVQKFGSLITPSELANLFTDWLKTHMFQENAWVMTTVDGPAGRLIFQPLGSAASDVTAVILNHDNPFVSYMRGNLEPLTQQDVDSLNVFALIPSDERQLIREWQRKLYLPISAHGRLVAIAGLQAKNNGESYRAEEFSRLQQMAAQFGSLLIQSQNFDLVRQVNQYVFTQNRELARENRRLGELVNLHEQFTALMSPELRQPLTDLELQLLQVQNQADGNNLNGSFDKLQDKATAAQAVVDNLIAVASRLEKQTEFKFAPLYIDSVIRTAVKNLDTMAHARRITVEIDVRGKILPVWGDDQRLVEAVQQVLHNALKFNKLNSIVVITCEMKSNEVRIQIIDHGVGIPPNRMDDIWTGMQKLFSNEETGLRRRTRVGLPLARFIVQSHGGRIEARSTYGMGSTFTIFLPALLTREA